MAAVWQKLRQCPVIPSVWDDKGLEQVTRIPVTAVFLQYGGLFTVPDMANAIRSVHPDATVFFHIDLADGIAADETGVRFIARSGLQGIVTTRPALVEAAKKIGLAAVLRVFIQDSRSLRRAVQLAQRCGPDALDVLPGPVVPEVIGDLREHLSQPIIAGGLIREEEQVRDLLKAGCRGVGTSQPDLWALNKLFRAAAKSAASPKA
ncbi:MAG TPA: glycerol-3-phosphate responsive antiterminator [Symbiobacteriaceae bacterium]|jgi:glycerol uptake operon antiterminator|nr:glycerol-3-phosphate responsive antiterminator [Symbiobacteriaceae bacterium]